MLMGKLQSRTGLLLVSGLLLTVSCGQKSTPQEQANVQAVFDDKDVPEDEKLSGTFECTRNALSMIAKIRDPQVGQYATLGIGVLPYCLALDSIGLVTNTVNLGSKAIDWLLHGRAKAKLRDNISTELRQRLPQAAPYLEPYLKEGKTQPHFVLAVSLALIASDSMAEKDQVTLVDGRKLTKKDIEKAWGKDSDAAFAFKSVMNAAEEMRSVRDMSKEELLTNLTALMVGVLPSQIDTPSLDSLDALLRMKGYLTFPVGYITKLGQDNKGKEASP